ncbi:YbjN domain-containing protein [Corynebacterium sp. CCM 9185]|uniref:YbjN domain-containing protein n=1 Tax=Corynebacterium marambiense TaxID=2765364 RepID=A0ABS0VRQ6_9CORY|nr:YbjN domain-containing protein [Corynebacterium marambiense]MBI8999417.1 YbjN domain-containing protein [Corynebacterium marambiense]MCK7662255.1 YbjN domain-containing protein [Corynebacterium marambiense]MCX7541523.1 YbjN domain-containing protein [Corynebacterium marambiense]
MALPMVTHARVESFLRSEELNFDRDEDGDIVVGFQDIIFFITIEDNLLRVAGWWRGELTDDDAVERAVTAANMLNRDLVIPKTVVAGNGPNVIFENALQTSEGLTDDQLNAYLVGSLQSSFHAASKLAEDLPDLLPATEEEDN